MVNTEPGTLVSRSCSVQVSSAVGLPLSSTVRKSKTLVVVLVALRVTSTVPEPSAAWRTRTLGSARVSLSMPITAAA